MKLGYVRLLVRDFDGAAADSVEAPAVVGGPKAG